MADNLTNTAESAALNFLTGNSATGPSGALKLALMTVNGSDSAAGTEVVGGSYARQTIAFPSSTGGAAVTNSSAVEFVDMPACTVVGFEIYDSAGSPVRFWYGAATANKTVAAGDTYRVPAGQISLSIS